MHQVQLHRQESGREHADCLALRLVRKEQPQTRKYQSKVHQRDRKLHQTKRHTAIETRNWDTIVIPNSMLMKGEVMILGRRTGQPVQHRMWVYFNVDFRIPPADVIATVEKALRGEAIPNVAQDPPFSKLDLISCCNVLIYLGDVLQRKVWSILHYALKPTGFLVLGPSESIGTLSESFHQVEGASGPEPARDSVPSDKEPLRRHEE